MANAKPFYMSKAKIAAILMMVGAIIKLALDYINTGSVSTEAVTTFLGGFGIFGVRDAIK